MSVEDAAAVDPLGVEAGTVSSSELGRAQRRMLQAIEFYQRGAEGRPSPCRFFPSCSEYGHEAIATHGAGRGLWLTVRRLLRCRPFGPSGFDPVPLPRDHRVGRDHPCEEC